MAEPELVTIGIPAYNSARFLSATVRSALAQDYPRIRIVISVDPSTDGTADLAGTLAEAHGFEVVLQPRRLGWIANSNAVLNAMDSPFGMILPHDDLLLPSYVSRCMAALKANETAAVACSDLQFIREGWITTQLELRGDRPDRVVRCIEDGFDGVNYRGVIRFDRFARRDVPDAIGGFAGDTLWMLRMAIAGEVIRVPEVLYQKRLRKHSAHAAWKRMKKRMLDRRWLAHVAEMHLVLLRDAPDLMLDARIRRAFSIRARRLGHAAFINSHPLQGGWTGRFPLAKAHVEHLRYVLGSSRGHK